jgi:hypothetical protein
MSHFHAIVWIDHTKARVFHVGASGTDGVILQPQSAGRGRDSDHRTGRR